MILVTGGSGFLGQHLVRHLSAQGLQVKALYNNTAPTGELKDLPNVTWHQCDLLDIYAVEEMMQGITDVYHCAAMVSFDPREREAMLHFNVESTANIVNHALEQGIRKLVHVSSVAAIGRNGETTKHIDEEQEWGESRYNSAYGLSKYMAEMEVWRAIGEGLDAVVANPGIILGPGNWDTGSAQLMKLVDKEFPFYTQGTTSWVSVDDTVKALVMLMDSDISAERYIISAGNYPYVDIFTMMAKALDRRPPRYKANNFMTGIVWRLSTLRNKLTGGSMLITKETATTAGSYCCYDNTKFLSAFPAFAYESMEDTIARMARSFRFN